MLTRLQAAKVAKVGIANQPPFSALNPDGSMTGIAPSMAQAILERLGIPKMEGTIATYGDLIPGLFAGRWDFVAASLTITKERCTQVLFSDPLSFEGPSIVSVPGRFPEQPKTLAELVKMKAKIGVPSGGAQFNAIQQAGVLPENIAQFPNDSALVDGLFANRIQYGWMSHLPIVGLVRRRNLKLDIVFPVADSSAPGAANAFRMEDTDFYEAYQKELRAMKASGEYLKIANEWGFEIPPELMNTTAAQQCAAVGGSR
jgi:polar amino acid transport system substrate-binding protein